jgi:hypothetical protein
LLLLPPLSHNDDKSKVGNLGSLAEVTAPPGLDTEDKLVYGSVIDRTEDHQIHESPSQVFDELKLSLSGIRIIGQIRDQGTHDPG